MPLLQLLVGKGGENAARLLLYRDAQFVVERAAADAIAPPGRLSADQGPDGDILSLLKTERLLQLRRNGKGDGYTIGRFTADIFDIKLVKMTHFFSPSIRYFTMFDSRVSALVVFRLRCQLSMPLMAERITSTAVYGSIVFTSPLAIPPSMISLS